MITMPQNDASYRQAYQSSVLAEKYERDIYDPKGFDARLWQVEQEGLKKLLMRHVPNLQSAQALDFACGTGRILKFLRPLVGNLTGVDISQAMLDRAAMQVQDVRLVCADILKTPEVLPQDLDLITSFRFVLLAEPALRVACIRELAGHLKKPSGRMVLNTHGNPASFRFLAEVRNRIFRPGSPPKAKFSIGQMRALAADCRLRMIGTAGAGFLPRSISMKLPAGIALAIERIISRVPFMWRFASNIIFIFSREDD